MKINSIQSRLNLLFLAFALLVVISVLVTFWGINTQKKDALIINLAGRQRMLLQQIARLTLEIENHNRLEDRLSLQESVTAFDQTLAAMREGGNAPYLTGFSVSLPALRYPSVQKQLDQIFRDWQEFHPKLDLIISTEPGTSRFADSAAEITSGTPPLVEDADRVVRLYEAYATSKQTRIIWIQTIFLISALLLVGLGSLMTRRSVIDPIDELGRTAERIGSGDLDTPIMVAGLREISVLNASFEEMRSRLLASQQECLAWTETLEERVVQRTIELEAFYEVIREITSRLEIHHVLQSVTEKACQLVQGEVAYLCLLDNDEQKMHLHAASGPQQAVARTWTYSTATLPDLVLSTNQALLCGVKDCRGSCEILASPYRTSHVAAPLRTGNSIIGALCVGSSTPECFDNDDQDLLTRLANTAAISLENARLYEQAERTASLEERHRLAAEMHDGMAQSLTFVEMMLDLASVQINNNDRASAQNSLQRGQSALAEISNQTRAIIENLHQDFSPHLTLQDRMTALLVEFEEEGYTVEWKNACNKPLLLPGRSAEQILRVVREALLNARKHSRADRVSVSLDQQGELYSIRIEDNGIGFDLDGSKSDDGNRHFGLRIMQARAALIGGSVEIDSKAGRGTRVNLIWRDSEDVLQKSAA